MLDWFVVLTPLVLLPIFLLFAFVGCAQILGIEEGVTQPPEPDPEITFEYPAGLYRNPDDSPGAFPGLRRIAWEFDATGLVYQGGGVVSPNFDQDRHRLTTPEDNNPSQGDPLQLGGDVITFANLGSPVSGTLSCNFAHNVDDNPQSFDITKTVGDDDFWTWGFDISLTPF